MLHCVFPHDLQTFKSAQEFKDIGDSLHLKWHVLVVILGTLHVLIMIPC